MLCSHPKENVATHALEAVGHQDITLDVCLICGATRRTVAVRGMARETGRWHRPTMNIEGRIQEIVAVLDDAAESTKPDPNDEAFRDDVAYLSNVKVAGMLATSLLVHVQQCDIGFLSTTTLKDE